MKRRTNALLVACAALVLSVILVWGSWRNVAYVPMEVSNEITLGTTWYKLRWPWLPGRSHWAPDQLCTYWTKLTFIQVTSEAPCGLRRSMFWQLWTIPLNLGLR